MSTYLSNAFSINMVPQGTFEVTNLSLSEARACLAEGFTSVVGHAATAEVFSRLLGLPITENRLSITLEPGDRLICGALGARLPEGKILTETELTAIPIRWVAVYFKKEL